MENLSVKSWLAQAFGAGGMPPGQLGYLVWSAAAAARDLDPVAPSLHPRFIQVVPLWAKGAVVWNQNHPSGCLW